MSDIGSQVREILSFHLGIDGAQLADDTRFEDLGADSLDVIEIVMSCEERFGVEIPNREARALATVGDAMRCVAAQIEAQIAVAAALAAEGFAAPKPAAPKYRYKPGAVACARSSRRSDGPRASAAVQSFAVLGRSLSTRRMTV